MSSYKDWHIPLARADITLQVALDSLSESRVEQQTEPLMLKLAADSNLNASGLGIFHRTLDLHQHDCIHILLGRGLLEIDEVFTTGFSMGSVMKVKDTEQSVYAFVAKHIYPNVYKFTDQELALFKDAIRLAYISNCSALDRFNFSEWLEHPIGTIRDAVGIEEELFRAYYAVEQRKYPQSYASQRLLPEKLKVVAF